MTNATLDPKPKTATRRTRKPSKTAPTTPDAAGVTISSLGFDDYPDVVVSGTREIRDPRLVEAIREHLDATAEWTAIRDAFYEAEARSDERQLQAEKALDELLGQMEGFRVVYKGLLFGDRDKSDWSPAAPVVVLID
jgi:hypothetical protein